MTFHNPPCKGKTDLFYPQDIEGRGRPLFEVMEQFHTIKEMAKAICYECPYQEPCLQIGLESELYGIWGGTTAKERKQMRREQKISLRRNVSLNRHKACGTEEGYRYCQENGFSCSECVQAHSIFLIGEPLTKTWNPEADHQNCGTEKAYQMLARRAQKRGGKAVGQVVKCEACKNAHNAFMRARYRRQRMSGM